MQAKSEQLVVKSLSGQVMLFQRSQQDSHVSDRGVAQIRLVSDEQASRDQVDSIHGRDSPVRAHLDRVLDTHRHQQCERRNLQSEREQKEFRNADRATLARKQVVQSGGLQVTGIPRPKRNCGSELTRGHARRRFVVRDRPNDRLRVPHLPGVTGQGFRARLHLAHGI
ncbi:hypothetical protein DEJ03_00250 [Curtobacterium sp. MCLR17_043]|nr:hypothetical protein DEJ03_00250 [Curtobacterium sp. MCLR17_043]